MRRHAVELVTVVLGLLVISSLSGYMAFTKGVADKSAMTWVPPGSQPAPEPMQFGPPPPTPPAEKVKVPASPIAGKAAASPAERAAPPTPAEESKHGGK